MSASLRPVVGRTREVQALLEPWVRFGGDPIVVRTSGSTGEPKQAVLSHEAVLASARATHERLGGPGRWLLDLPVNGIAGLQVLVRSALAGTDPVVVSEHDDLETAIEELVGPRLYASLVPTQLHRLDASDRLDVLAGLDALLVGGAATDPALLDRARDAGVNVVRTYGMTETCGGCVYEGRPLDGVGAAHRRQGPGAAGRPDALRRVRRPPARGRVVRHRRPRRDRRRGAAVDPRSHGRRRHQRWA